MARYYWIFSGYLLLAQICITILNLLIDKASGTVVSSIIAVFAPAMAVVHHFIKAEERAPTSEEARILCNVTFLLVWIISISYFMIGLAIIVVYYAGIDGLLLLLKEPKYTLNLMLDVEITSLFWKILLAVFVFFSLIYYGILNYCFGSYAVKQSQKLL